MFDMDALVAKVKADRAAAGLVAKDGVHCPTQAHKDFHDLRHELRQRADWGNLPDELLQKLIAAREAKRNAI